MKNKDYSYLKKVILRLNKKQWNIKDFKYIDDLSNRYIKNNNLDKLSLLRYGEVLLGKYCDIDYSNLDNSRRYIEMLLDDMDNFNITVLITLIITITQLVISTNDGKINFNDIKEE